MQTKEQNTTTTAGRAATGARKAGRGFRISAGATIGRPVGEVFALAGDYENDPLWRSGVVEMRYETPGVLRTGARTREIMRFLGGRVTTVAEIVEFERDRKTAFASRGAPVPVWGSRTFEPDDDSTTRFTYELSARPGGPWALLSPILATVLRRQAARDLKKLKTLLERGGPGAGATDGREGESRTGKVGIMQDNVQVVSDIYEAFGRGDVPAISGLFHPEAEVYQSARLPWGGEFGGAKSSACSCRSSPEPSSPRSRPGGSSTMRMGPSSRSGTPEARSARPARGSRSRRRTSGRWRTGR